MEITCGKRSAASVGCILTVAFRIAAQSSQLLCSTLPRQVSSDVTSGAVTSGAVSHSATRSLQHKTPSTGTRNPKKDYIASADIAASSNQLSTNQVRRALFMSRGVSSSPIRQQLALHHVTNIWFSINEVVAAFHQCLVKSNSDITFSLSQKSWLELKCSSSRYQVSLGSASSQNKSGGVSSGGGAGVAGTRGGGGVPPSGYLADDVRRTLLSVLSQDPQFDVTASEGAPPHGQGKTTFTLAFGESSGFFFLFSEVSCAKLHIIVRHWFVVSALSVL